MTRRVPIWMGLCALGFYGAHAVELTGYPAINFLWSCNVACVLVFTGLLLGLRTVNAVGGFMLAMGNIFWIIELATGGPLLYTAPLTHVGIFALSLMGIRRMGLPRQTWWLTALTMLLLSGVTAWLGTPTENINHAHATPAGYESWYPSHGAYLVFIFCFFAAVSAAFQVLLTRTGFARTGRRWLTGAAPVPAPMEVETTQTEEAVGDAIEHPSVQKYARHVNPTFVKLLGVMGYGRLLTKARGVWIWDHEGRRYLDCLAGFGAVSVGHNHPRMVTRMTRFLADNPINFLHIGPAGQLAELGARLSALTADPLDVIVPANTGAEAVEGGMKLARAATGRPRFVYCTGAYHGSSLGTLSVMGVERMRSPFEPLLTGCDAVPFGDLVALEQALAAKDVAGVVIDPGLCESGAVRPPTGYLAGAQALCKAAGTLLILDEVQTGLGRTGTMFAYEAEGVVPDILALAKSLSGGIAPIGAVMTSAEVHARACGTFARFDLFNTTFGGNAFSCTAALEALDIIVDERLVENSRCRGEQLLAELRSRLAGHPLVVDIRGRGLLVCIELGPTEAGWLNTLAPSLVEQVSRGVLGQWLAVQLLERGLICQPATQRWNVLKLTPPLTISAQEITTVVDTVVTVIDGYHSVAELLGDVTGRLGKQFLSGGAF